MSETAAMDEACPPEGALAYICGLRNAEDIVPVGGTRWLLASSISPLGAPEVGPGRLYLIDSEAKTAGELFPGDDPAFRHDTAMYPDCPGPMNLEAFDTHGLAIRETSPGTFRVYSVSHGERESIEAFELDASGDEPAITWVGCVLVPERMWANSVAILADGGFVTTKFWDPTDPDGTAPIFAGEVSGAVYEWRPGGEVTQIPGTELSGPNGVALSADDRFMFVAAFGGHEVVRFDRTASPPTKASVSLPISPDNLRWTENDLLLTVGDNVTPPEECAEPPCETGWTVIGVDPSTMAASAVAGADGEATLQNASAALQVGDEIWIGTYGGDRVAYIRMR